jgi:hypothetical protein
VGSPQEYIHIPDHQQSSFTRRAAIMTRFLTFLWRLLPRAPAVIVLLAAVAPGARGAQDGEHGFSEACFSVLLDGKRTPDYVVLTVRVEVPESGTCAVEAQAAFLTEDPGKARSRIALRSFSTRDTSITGASVTGDTLRFDLLLDGRDADRKIRLRSIRNRDTGMPGIKASGLWSDQTHTSFVRAQWKQIESIELRYPRLVSSRGR